MNVRITKDGDGCVFQADAWSLWVPRDWTLERVWNVLRAREWEAELESQERRQSSPMGNGLMLGGYPDEPEPGPPGAY